MLSGFVLDDGATFSVAWRFCNNSHVRHSEFEEFPLAFFNFRYLYRVTLKNSIFSVAGAFWRFII